MKLKLTIAAAFVALAFNANAAVYYVNNVVAGDASDVLWQNIDGTLSSGGIVSIGYFAGGAPSSSIADIATTISSFTLQTFSLTGGESADLGGSFAGYVQGPLNVQGALITAPSTLIGQNMYLFAGNGATLESSTGWALAAIRPIQDDVPFEQQYVGNPAEVQSVLFGTIGTFTGDSGAATGTFSTMQFVPVPEPSAALLGALGALGLLRRRRN